MRKLRIQMAVLALALAPMASRASEQARPNPKLPEAEATAPLVLKTAAPESRLNTACRLGQVGGTALSLFLGSGKAWDALISAALGQPPSAEQRAFCALGEALAPNVVAATEAMAEDILASAQRHADAAKDMMAVSGDQIQQAWAGLLDAATEKSASSGSDLARLCETTAGCAWLRDTAADTLQRLRALR